MSYELVSDASSPLPLPKVAAAAVALCGLVVALAVVVPGLITHAGAPPRSRATSTAVGEVALAFAVLAVLVAAAAGIAARPRDRRHAAPEIQSRERKRLPLWQRLVILAIVLAAVAAPILALAPFVHGHSGTERGTPLLTTHAGAHRASSVPRPTQTRLHVRWPFFLVLGGGALGAAALLGLWRDRFAQASREPAPAPVLAAAVGAALDDLESERDPRRAVILAYARMERALGEAGVERRPAEAPLEYLRRALGHVLAAGPSAVRLTRLFERARFSPHPIGEPLRQEALDALTDVRAELEGGR
jgi:MFS family permease